MHSSSKICYARLPSHIAKLPRTCGGKLLHALSDMKWFAHRCTLTLSCPHVLSLLSGPDNTDGLTSPSLVLTLSQTDVADLIWRVKSKRSPEIKPAQQLRHGNSFFRD